MSSSKSSNKAARLEERKRLRNRSVKSSVKTHIAKAEKLAKSELAESYQLTAISSVDKAVSKGVFHKNKGARLKSRLMRKLNKEQSALSSQQSRLSTDD